MGGFAAQGPTIDEKVQFLASPRAYSHRPDRVDVVETHMSWVFLAGALVYKLKKPVRFSYVDLSSIEARRANCLEEVRVNRRLAGDVYLGVVALNAGAKGSLHLGDAGEVVDWLVQMRRLTDSRFLSTLLAQGTLSEREVERLATFLGTFYASADRPDLDPSRYTASLLREHDATRAMLVTPGFAEDPARTKRVLDRFDQVFAMQVPAIAQRVADRRIVEAHGDLRPEHICMTEPIVIFDALEFDRALRLLDPFDELAFLAMECAFAGSSWVGPALVRGVAAVLDDDVPGDLMTTFMASRALLRARLTLSHLLDEHPRQRRKWIDRAGRYVALADALLDLSGMRRPAVG